MTIGVNNITIIENNNNFITIGVNDIMNLEENQTDVEFLIDKSKNGKIRPWKEKKVMNTFLADSYFRIGSVIGSKTGSEMGSEMGSEIGMKTGREISSKLIGKAYRARSCATKLSFKRFDDGSLKLDRGIFCQIRLCPICSWRRELKMQSQLFKVVSEVEKLDYRFIFLTLTCENVCGHDLKPTINMLNKGFDRLSKRADFKKVAKGFFRALEITHDVNEYITKEMYKKAKDYYDNRNLKVGDCNPNFDKYHPHFHVMIAVNKSYFKKGDYIKQKEWVNLWQQSLRVNYIPVVDVRAVRDLKGKGIKEVAKYTVKDTDFIVKEDKQLTDETVKILDDALAYRRLVAYGGIMKKIHKELNLDEDVTADVMIDGNGEEDLKALPYILEHFKWHIGFKNYVLVKKDSDKAGKG